MKKTYDFRRFRLASQIIEVERLYPYQQRLPAGMGKRGHDAYGRAFPCFRFLSFHYLHSLFAPIAPAIRRFLRFSHSTTATIATTVTT